MVSYVVCPNLNIVSPMELILSIFFMPLGRGWKYVGISLVAISGTVATFWERAAEYHIKWN